nr:unnamed protein product [Callosobruchus analis]CAI5848245.1 unnamed protein product [Callosobruchus analis]
MVLTREIRDEIKGTVSHTINSILNEEYVKQLVEKVTDSIVKTLERRIAHIEEKLEKIIKENSTVITDIKEEAAILKSENEFLLRKFDDIDQKGRCNSLRIFNLKESEGENLSNEVTQLVNSKLGIKIKDGDIITCIRVGEKRGNRPRGVLLKLDNMELRRNIYSKKKMLKGSGVVIKEDLSDYRLKLMDAAIEKTSFRRVWSFNGNIFVLHNNKKMRIKSKEDLAKL